MRIGAAAIFGLLGLVAAGCTAPAADDAAIDSELDDPTAPVYPSDRAQSPLSADVVAHLRAIVAAGKHRERVLSKIGDSITFSTSFARCLASDSVRIDAGRAEADDTNQDQLEAARQIFSETQIAGGNSFTRVSASATVGWMAVRAITDTPSSPLDRELDATNAAFAVVMYGTNDTYAGGDVQFRRALTRIVDRMIARGVVPVLSTIPPRADATANALVPKMNAVIRKIAEQKRVPLMDLWLRLSPLPKLGLGPDGIHPSAGGDGCDFSASGMNHGYNHRNLLLLEALDRMQRYVLDGAPAPDVSPDPAPAPSNDTPAATEEGGCFSYTLQVQIPNHGCVQSVVDSLWYQCIAGTGWVAPVHEGVGVGGACTVEHAL